MTEQQLMNVSVPFVVFSLPRSRSAWLSHYLGNDSGLVGHDVLLNCDSLEDFERCFTVEGMLGTCETAAAWGWKIIQRRLPVVRFVTIRRPVDEVLSSLRRHGLNPSEEYMRQMDGVLDVIESLPRTLSVDFEDLDCAGVCEQVYRFCRGETPDDSWTARMLRLNIQVNMPSRIEQIRNRAPALSALREMANAELDLLGGPVGCLH